MAEQGARLGMSPSEYARHRKARKRAAARARILKDPEAERRRKRAERGTPEPLYPAPDRCECCGRPDVILDRRLCVDHDHVTGRFRGWLCNNCNRGIGLLGDSAIGLNCAMNYINRDLIHGG